MQFRDILSSVSVLPIKHNFPHKNKGQNYYFHILTNESLQKILMLSKKKKNLSGYRHRKEPSRIERSRFALEQHTSRIVLMSIFIRQKAEII